MEDAVNDLSAEQTAQAWHHTTVVNHQQPYPTFITLNPDYLWVKALRDTKARGLLSLPHCCRSRRSLSGEYELRV